MWYYQLHIGNQHKTFSDPASINPDSVLEVGGDLSPVSTEMEPIILDPHHQPIVWYEESPKAPQGPLNISPFFFIEGKLKHMRNYIFTPKEISLTDTLNK